MKQILISESLILQVQRHLERQAEGKQPWSQEDSKALAAQLRATLVTPQNLVIGGKYNWINQPDRLIYIGVKSGWYQFKKIGDARPVWCEVPATNLSSFEQTKD